MKKPIPYRRRQEAIAATALHQKFQWLLDAEDGNWSGLAIPNTAVFPSVIAFPIQAKHCKFDKLSLENIVFKKPVDFSNSAFDGGLVLKNVTFEEEVLLDRCLFNGPVETSQLRCKGAASFCGADFCGKTVFRAVFGASANFNSAIFRDSVTFSGWRDISLSIQSTVASFSMVGTATVLTNHAPSFSERVRAAIGKLSRLCVILKQKTSAAFVFSINWLKGKIFRFRRHFSKSDPNTKVFSVFEGTGQLQDVVFSKPDLTVFSQVNLSKVYVKGTNLRGVRFLGVNWWQPKLGRNGLYDEQFIRLNSDGPFRHRELPILEETCRNARVALEENRNFAAATDFYVGEMEAARAQLGLLRRHFFSVPALYCSVSRYGSSVAVALRTFALIVLLHVSLTLLLQHPQSAETSLIDVEAAALHSVRGLMLQSSDTSLIAKSGSQAWFDLLFRLLGPAQIAMVVLAFRARIKRN